MDRESDLQPEGHRFKSQVWLELSVGGVNNHRSLHLQYHDWGEVRPLSKAPNCSLGAIALAAHSYGCVCVHYCACAHMDGLKAEHKFQVWDTRHFTSLINK